jgi:hypothetical protein
MTSTLFCKDKNLASFNHKLYITALFSLWLLYYAWMSLSGISLTEEHLISDARFYLLAGEQLAAKPETVGLGIPIQAKPISERFLLHAFSSATSFADINSQTASLYLSRLIHLIFVCSVYLFVIATGLDQRIALAAGAVSIVETHILGGSTFGVRGFGFLPRDLGQVLMIWTLTLYLFASAKPLLSNLLLLAICFTATSVVYPLSAIHTALLLVLIEAPRFRLAKQFFLTKNLLIVMPFIVISLFVLIKISIDRADLSPTTKELILFRNSFMVFNPNEFNGWLYIRRFAAEIFVVASFWLFFRRQLLLIKKPIIKIFVLSCFISVFALLLEAHTTLLPLFLSRFSFFSHLTFLLIFFWILFENSRRISVLLRVPCTIIIVCFLTVHSNAMTLVRWAKSETDNIGESKFIKSEICNTINKGDGKDKAILVFSNESEDLADLVRYVCRAPVYVTYKDGGITLSDGVLGTIWKNRWEKTNGKPQTKIPLFKKEIENGEIQYIFYRKSDPASCLEFQEENFFLINDGQKFCSFHFLQPNAENNKND